MTYLFAELAVKGPGIDFTDQLSDAQTAQLHTPALLRTRSNPHVHSPAGSSLSVRFAPSSGSSSSAEQQQKRSGQSPPLYPSRSISSGTHSDEFLDALESVSDRSESVDRLSAAPTLSSSRLATSAIMSLGSSPELFTTAAADQISPLVTTLTQSLAMLAIGPRMSSDADAAAADCAGGDAPSASPGARETQQPTRRRRRQRVRQKSGSSGGSNGAMDQQHGDEQFSHSERSAAGGELSAAGDATVTAAASSHEAGGHVSMSPETVSKQPWHTVNRTKQKPKPTPSAIVRDRLQAQLSQISSHSASGQQTPFELKKHSSPSGLRFKHRYPGHANRLPAPPTEAAPAEPSQVGAPSAFPAMSSALPQHPTQSQPQSQSLSPSSQPQAQSQAAESTRTLSTTSSSSMHSSQALAAQGPSESRAVAGAGAGTGGDQSDTFASDRVTGRPFRERRGDWPGNYKHRGSGYGGRGGSRAPFANPRGTPPDAFSRSLTERSFLGARAVSGPIRGMHDALSYSPSAALEPEAAAALGSPRPRNESISGNETAAPTAARGWDRGGWIDGRGSRGQFWGYGSYQQRGGGRRGGGGRGGFWVNQQQQQRPPRGRFAAPPAIDASQANPFLKQAAASVGAPHSDPRLMSELHVSTATPAAADNFNSPSSPAPAPAAATNADSQSQQSSIAGLRETQV